MNEQFESSKSEEFNVITNLEENNILSENIINRDESLDLINSANLLEFNDRPEYIEELKRLSVKIEKLNVNHHIEIGKILYNNNIKLTENNNGIFVKLNNIPITVINKINNYLTFINSQESHLNIDETRKITLEKSFFKDNSR